MRMSRSRRRMLLRRQEREREYRWIRQFTVASGLGLLPAVEADAASMYTVADVPAGFDELENERRILENYRAAQQNARDAKADLQQAKADLRQAKSDRADAAAGLQAAQKQLKDAKYALKAIQMELTEAQELSAQRTQEAIAAQQAVADFQPQVWEQETVVQEAQAQADAAAANVPSASIYSSTSESVAANSDLAARIEAAWQSVNYEQNRLEDVVAMVREAQGTMSEDQSVKRERFEAQWAAYEDQVAAADAALDEANAYLDALNDQLDALEDARQAAEDAEAEARERVQDLVKDKIDAEVTVKESQKDLNEAENWNRETAGNLEQAEMTQTDAEVRVEETQYELNHFGEGLGFSTGFDYNSWKDAYGIHGHQTYVPLSFYAAQIKWEFSLENGWLDSNTGDPYGKVSGWTDTTLGVLYRNDHKKYDVHYHFSVNVPTGEDNVHQNAMLPDDLVRFSTFGQGWDYTPQVSVIHHITDEDKVTFSAGMTWHGPYDFRFYGNKLSFYEYKIIDPKDSKHNKAVTFTGEETEEVVPGKVHPGKEYQQEIRYQHSGADQQFSASLGHTSYGRSSQTRMVADIDMHQLNEDSLYKHFDDVSLDEHYRQGDDWTWRMFYRVKDTPRKYWLFYWQASYDQNTGYFHDADEANTIWNLDSTYFGSEVRQEGRLSLQDHTQSGVHRHYFGIGQQYVLGEGQSLSLLFNYLHCQGIYYTPILGKVTPAYNRPSVILRYRSQMPNGQEMSIALERYVLRTEGDIGERFHGWNISAQYSWSF